MITILCGGTRGDVQPYLALAIELKKLGKAVRIAVSRNHESFIRSYGIDYYCVDVDFESLNVDKNMIREAQQADNPLKMFLSFQKMKKYGIHMVNHYFSACQGSELIVYHPGVAIGYFAAEKLGIASVLALPFPLSKTKEQTSVILYGKVKSNSVINLFSYFLLQNMLWMASESSLKPFWKEKFGHLPEHFGCPFERHTDYRHPAIVSCSNFVFKRPGDWNENVHQNGYWFLEEPNEYIPPKELTDFLENGEKPIYIGFGSMLTDQKPEKISKIIIAGLARVGKRAILSGIGKLQNIPDTIFTIDNIPHSWLFPRMSAVCHHGGAGTTAAGFKAGVPSVIFPFALDQYAWAQRAYDLGVGPKPVPINKLTSEKFADAIYYAFQEKIKANSKALAQNIASENGAGDSARVIADCLESSNVAKH
jgi:sterol 3beta-glucosyltransferase